MKCRFQEFETPDDKGWRRLRCECCGLTLHPTPSPLDRCHAQCRCWGLGDIAVWLLSGVGITSARVSWLLRKPCGCAARQETLNDATVTAVVWWRAFVEMLKW